MNKLTTIAVASMIAFNNGINAQDNVKQNEVNIGKSDIRLGSDLMTPEALWAMGRISSAEASPDGKHIVYQVGYYSVKENKSHHVICITDAKGNDNRQLTTSAKNETDPTWIENGKRIAYLSEGQIWAMNPDGSGRTRLSNIKDGVEGFKFSPDGKKVIIIKSLPFHDIIKKNPDDLPLATGRVATDLMYRHWDHYVESIQHPFVAKVTENGIDSEYDIMKGEPFECPMEPFGGIEQLAWSMDSKSIAYTSRKKTGKDYSISTDSDIYLYNTETGETKNLCKPDDYRPIETDATHTMKDQKVNSAENLANNPGYDTNPQFSPDGKYIAWQSMARDGYESDRNRLCVYNIATGDKTYVTETFDSNVDAFCWNHDSKSLSFIGVWHGCVNMYQTSLKGEVRQLTNDWADYVSISPANDGNKILAMRQSYSAPTDIYVVNPGKEIKKTEIRRITQENKHITDQLSFGKVQQRWVKTTDGKNMLCWIILPSHFDPNKKYPTLLFCEGGPQSPVSQFWSYRWNFQIMAANGYVIVAPNRHGLPGFGSEWNEEISGDWTGQCMDDYLSAIDNAAANLPFVDKDRLGAVGASFGGFSVYYLAGHHDKRFKCFISHDGAFNLESMYTDTEENWFSNWEYEDAYWKKNISANAKKTYENSPHRFIDNWDTPILCIHGEKDYRINANQGMGAFNAARMKGIPAELLIFPDENHWVLKPQNGVLWQRTFFGWLDKWLKK
ncbi:S9 family peptidase [Xylanibacter muris]|uniref:S9 family peptidase n=1 Tax=Xylanibacter muris TaxID=2736290 RepID=A0ABX2AJR9_9BACT|nr:S9 family peptidase [Xylanibacter muris]NPD91310.1 S9 family peptidase [Xylanibacter muris]